MAAETMVSISQYTQLPCNLFELKNNSVDEVLLSTSNLMKLKIIDEYVVGVIPCQVPTAHVPHRPCHWVEVFTLHSSCNKMCFFFPL